MMRRAARQGFYGVRGGVSHARSAAHALRLRGPEPEGLRILYYHRISDDKDELAVKPGRFRQQMEYLAAGGTRAVDVDEAVRLLSEGHDGRGVVGLSFDDAYLDNLEALPVLERLGFTATIYAPTGVIDGTMPINWYDRPPPLLSWEQIERLDGRVFRFGAHTVSHPNLLALSTDEARAEIAGSKRTLEDRLGRDVTTFCYPAGLFSERDRLLAIEAGFTSAVSCEPGTNTPAADRFFLRRTQIEPRDRLYDFRAKLGGGHDSPLPARGLYRRVRFGMR